MYLLCVPGSCALHIYLCCVSFTLALVKSRYRCYISQRGSLGSKQLRVFNSSKARYWQDAPMGALSWLPNIGNFSQVPNKPLLLELCALSTLNVLGVIKTKACWKSLDAFILVLEEEKKYDLCIRSIKNRIPSVLVVNALHLGKELGPSCFYLACQRNVSNYSHRHSFLHPALWREQACGGIMSFAYVFLCIEILPSTLSYSNSHFFPFAHLIWL